MFIRLVRAELIKTKNIPILIILALFVVGVILIGFFHFLSLSLADYNRLASYDLEPNPWYFYYFGMGLLIYSILLPLALSILPFVIKNVEDKADAWKRTLILPTSIYKIHLSKLTVICFYASMFVGVTLGGLMLSGLLLSKLRPDFNFSQHPTYHQFLLLIFLKFELSALAIVVFGYAYLLFIKKTLVSLLLTVLLPLLCLLIIPPYNSAPTQLFLFKMERNKVLIREGNVFTDLHLTITSTDVTCIGIIVVALGVIFYKSTRPIIDYE